MMSLISNLYFIYSNIYHGEKVFSHLIKCSFQKLKKKVQFSNLKLLIGYFPKWIKVQTKVIHILDIFSNIVENTAPLKVQLYLNILFFILFHIFQMKNCSSAFI